MKTLLPIVLLLAAAGVGYFVWSKKLLGPKAGPKLTEDETRKKVCDLRMRAERSKSETPQLSQRLAAEATKLEDSIMQSVIC